MTAPTSSTPSPAPPSRIAAWVEAMRLRTLPVSVAGVLMAVALATMHGTFMWLPSLICLIFALLAQIASNFANEYFDYRDGLDRKGRVGPRRGVTEGDITPRAMRNAALITLGGAALTGCTLLLWGGWWLLLAGILIIAGALAYSAGPYPLSRHGWGEVAVVLFFGIAPVTLTYWLQTHNVPLQVWLTAIGTGLLGANVLIVNNYRDRADDAAVGKHTLAVKFGARFASALYLIGGIAAMALMAPVWLPRPTLWVWTVIYLAIHIGIWRKLRATTGTELNPLLGQTAILMFCNSAAYLISAIPL